MKNKFKTSLSSLPSFINKEGTLSHHYIKRSNSLRPKKINSYNKKRLEK